jgi:DNA-binding response OmpR family regulator
MANTVLIIESDKATISQAKAATEVAGYRFLSAETAADGLSTASEAIPSIIFINLATPGTNGLEICKTIHNTGDLSSIPIILITLREGKFDPVYKKLYGIVAFLKKPFEDTDMTALLQEHSPLTEEEAPAVEEETISFEGAEAPAEEEEAGAVFSIDETQASLQDLQSDFQQPLAEEEEAPSAGEGDEFEGTRPFALDETQEEGGALGEVEPSGFGEAGGEAGEEESGGFGEGGTFGEVEPSGFGEAGGEAGEEESGGFGEGGAFGEVEPSGFGEAGGEEAGGFGEGGAFGEVEPSGFGEAGEEEAGGFGEVEPSGFGEAGGEEEPAFGESEGTVAFGGQEEEGFGGGEEAGGFGDAGGEEEAGESWGFGGDEDQTMKMGGGDDEESTAVFEPDSLDWGAAEEEAEKTMAMGAPKPAPPSKEPGITEEAMPSFDDETPQADESFMDESMGAEEMPQMGAGEEDYSDLFEGGEKPAAKPSKKIKPKKGAVKPRPGIKRILIIVLILIVVGGLGFAGYTFFLAPQTPTPTPVALPEPMPAEPEEAPEPPVAEPEMPEPAEMPVEEAPVVVEKPAEKKPAPAAEKPSAATGVPASGYYVQFGVFGSDRNAKRMVSRVAEYNLSTIVEVKGKGKSKRNFVLLNERFKSRSAATKRAREVKRLTEYDTAVYRKK